MPEYKKIEEHYEYDGKPKTATALFFPEASIATITEVDYSTGGGLETRIAKQGMTLNELKEYFPQNAKILEKNPDAPPVNLSLLVRSIIYEAFTKEGETLEAGNVRNFWYTHLKSTITKVLGLGESNSVLCTINTAWGDMINSGLATYEGLNIVGGKESSRVSIVKDSPFSNLIIAVEKVDFFDAFKWIPRLFNCTLITAGGQPSRAVARAFIKGLADIEVDLDQTFYMCVASDLDPAGYYIQEAFKKQLEGAIDFYGGCGNVDIKRLFVRKDQITPELLISEAMPCRDKAMSEKARKSETTKWEYFCEQSDGGLYIPEPPGWNGAVYDINGESMVRALLEMNVFGKGIIERAIIKELLDIIEQTNDETKIMMPEIMRVFETMRKESIEDIFDIWNKRLIDPLKKTFLSDTDRWGRQIRQAYWDEMGEAESARDAETDPLDEACEAEVEVKRQEARDRVPDLYERQETIEAQIADLETQLADTNNLIDEKCSDIFSDISDLESQCEADKQPYEDEYKAICEVIEANKKFREARLQQFKDEHSTVFNPLEMALLRDVAHALSDEEVLYYFTDLEVMPDFQPHISRLLADSDMLIEDEVSCYEHPAPTFLEEDLLHKASKNKDENVGNVRNAFSPQFTDAMKDLIKTHVDGKVFEVSGEVEQVDLAEKVDEAIEETEQEIKDQAEEE